MDVAELIVQVRFVLCDGLENGTFPESVIIGRRRADGGKFADYAFVCCRQ